MNKLTYVNLMRMIARGEEFILTYLGKEYWISQPDNCILLTADEENSKCFKDLSDFILNARMLDGKLLSDVIDEID